MNVVRAEVSVDVRREPGTYARAWWWYYGKTGAQVKKLLSKNKARLIDIEPYSTGERAPATPW